MNYVEKKIEILEKKFDDNTISGEEIIELIKLYKTKNKPKIGTKYTTKTKNKPKTKQCSYCGKEFEYTHARQMYCSDDCKRRKDLKRRKELIYAKREPIVRTCIVCSKKFETKLKNRRFCSDECSKSVKKDKNIDELEILQEREDLRKIRPKDKDYKLKKYMVKAGLNEKSTWTIERDYYFFKPCKFDKYNENLYYIHDFNDNNDFSASLIKLTDTSLSEKEFEYYKSKGNLVFYEKLN